MGKDRFDFSEIDAALPAAERMQEEDRVADALENNYKAVRILGANVESSKTGYRKPCPDWTGRSPPFVRQAGLPSAGKPDGRLSGKGMRFAGR